MDDKQIFEFIKDNMNIQIDRKMDWNGDYDITVKLLLRNPDTKEFETIGSDSFFMSR